MDITLASFISDGMVNALTSTLIIALVLVITRFIFAAKMHYNGVSYTDQAVNKDNPALLIRLSGVLLGVAIAFISIAKPTGLGILADLTEIAKMGTLAIACVFISGYVNDRLILPALHNDLEIFSHRNVAVAIIEFATFTGTGLIFSGALSGHIAGESDIYESLIWFAIGQSMFVMVAMVYHYAAPSFFNAIAERKAAVAYSFGGTLLASAIALSHAIRGGASNWSEDLIGVAAYMGLWALVQIIAHGISAWIIIPGHLLRHELVHDNNKGAGFVDGLISIVITLAFVNFA